MRDDRRRCTRSRVSQRSSACGVSATGSSVRARTAIRRSVPAYAMPEDAVRALAPSPATPLWRPARPRHPGRPGRDRPRRAPRRSSTACLAGEPGGARAHAARRRASCSVPTASRLAGGRGLHGVDEAVAAARRVGYPVVLKSTSPRACATSPASVGVRGRPRRRRGGRATRYDVAHRAAGAAGGRPLRRAAHGRARASPASSAATRTRSSARSSASASPGRPPSCSATSAHRIPPLTDVDVTDLIVVGQGRTAAARPPGRRARAPGRARRPHRPRVGARRRPARGRRRWCSTRSTPGPAGVDVLGAEVVVRPPLVRKDPGRRG